MYNYSDLSDTDDFRGFTMQTWGGAVGIDNYFTDDLKLGIGYSYLDSLTEIPTIGIRMLPRIPVLFMLNISPTTGI